MIHSISYEGSTRAKQCLCFDNSRILGEHLASIINVCLSMASSAFYNVLILSVDSLLIDALTVCVFFLVLSLVLKCSVC